MALFWWMHHTRMTLFGEIVEVIAVAILTERMIVKKIAALIMIILTKLVKRQSTEDFMQAKICQISFFRTQAYNLLGERASSPL
jgi:predicted histidine transporter YuiF (NhaC family)